MTGPASRLRSADGRQILHGAGATRDDRLATACSFDRAVVTPE